MEKLDRCRRRLDYLLATAVRLTFVTWDQHIGVPAEIVLASLASRRYADASNFTAIVNHQRV
jgi:hypothetical protein